MRRSRIRPAKSNHAGAHFDLRTLFDQINTRFFGDRLKSPHLGWSARSWRRQFGCYDPGPNQILLNRRLDSELVPRFVVEHVLYHEMLHVKHPTRRSGCSLVSHSKNFRAEEMLFPEFQRARRFLDRLAR
jgi:predicted metal-dependent hydrolase